MRLRRVRTLQGRITVVLVGILVVTFAAAAVATGYALHTFLTGRLDAQLAAAADRVPAGVGAGQAVGTLVVRFRDGDVEQAVLVGVDGSATDPRLSTAQYHALAAVPVGVGARTVALGRLTDYRVRAETTADGELRVTGLPQDGVERTVTEFVVLESLVFVAVIVISSVAVATLVRRTMRPLRWVTDAASQVSELPLTTAGTLLPSGLAPTDSTTEVNQLADAFDRMLDHVRVALGERDATEERLRQFVVDASHEFRTPLATIRAHAESLRHGSGVAPPDSLERIDASTARMTALVEDLLLLARLDDAGPRAATTADLSRSVLESVVDARALAPGHHWRLDLPDRPVEIDADGGQVDRVVRNLVDNAALHTPAGSTVTVSVHAADECVTLVVADDGPGIPRALQGKAFDRFTRGDAARSSVRGSTGLGLAIARGVVVAHGGTIALASEPGDTRLTVVLPTRRHAGDTSGP